MKKVDEVVAGWTEDEREMLKDLIQECREREKILIENSIETKANLTKLSESLFCFASGFHKIRDEISDLADDLWRT